MADAAAAVLALLAAFWVALGIVIRQRATGDVGTGVVTALARSPWWWAGTGAAVAGYAFQALALSKGSLLLVQPLLVSSLLFALPMSARLTGQRIGMAQWGWAVLLTAALAVFVLVGQPRQGHYRPPVAAWAIVLAVFVPVVVACVAVAARGRGRRRAGPLAVAVAVLLGAIAVLTKICAHRLTEGGLHALLIVPAPYLLVALAAAAMVLQQIAFHAGALQMSVPIMLVGEPLVAVLMGIIVLGEHLAATGPAVLLLAGAVVAIVAATVALGRESGARDEQLTEDGDRSVRRRRRWIAA
ncbi:MAG TPA: DMT family transporter [Mycobacterium sp.]|nr:DMT family transporter [Mycobacterium sp.]